MLERGHVHMELVKLIAKDQTQGLVNTGTLVSRARATAAVETTHLDLKSLTVVVQGSGIHVRALKRLGTIQLRVDLANAPIQSLQLVVGVPLESGDAADTIFGGINAVLQRGELVPKLRSFHTGCGRRWERSSNCLRTRSQLHIPEKVLLVTDNIFGLF